MTGLCPQWLDLTGGKPLPEAVRELFALTSAVEYVVSASDYVAAGWKGEACKFPIGSSPRDGIVLIHADPLCPPGALWAWPRNRSHVSAETAIDEFMADAMAAARRLVEKVRP